MKVKPIKIEQNIYRLENGKHKVVMDYINQATNKKAKTRKTFSTLGQARKYRNEFDAKRKLNLTPQNHFKKVTLGQMVDIMKDQKKDLNSFDDITRHLDDIKYYFGSEKLIHKIDEAEIKGLTRHLQRRPKKGRHKGTLSNQSIDHVLKELRSLLRQATEKGFIDKVPKIKFLRNYGQRDFTLTLDEFKKVIEHLPDSPHPHRAMLIMAMNTGQRASDLANMTWDQIKDDHIVYRSTKTQRNGIHAPLMQITKDALEAHKAQSTSDYIFINPKSGEPQKSLRKALRTACKKAGIEPFTMHHMRHLATTVLLELTNGDRDLVKRIIGWANMDMVDRYGHIGDRAIPAFEKLNQRLTSGLANAF